MKLKVGDRVKYIKICNRRNNDCAICNELRNKIFTVINVQEQESSYIDLTFIKISGPPEIEIYGEWLNAGCFKKEEEILPDKLFEIE